MVTDDEDNFVHMLHGKFYSSIQRSCSAPRDFVLHRPLTQLRSRKNTLIGCDNNWRLPPKRGSRFLSFECKLSESLEGFFFFLKSQGKVQQPMPPHARMWKGRWAEFSANFWIGSTVIPQQSWKLRICSILDQVSLPFFIIFIGG